MNISDNFGEMKKQKKKWNAFIIPYRENRYRRKLTIYINAARSLMLGLINIYDYFHIVNAITESLCEDLVCFLEYTTDKVELPGKMEMPALARAGLMIGAGIDANADAEKQKYVFTTLRGMID